MRGFAVPAQNTIDLEGITGEFNTPNSSFRVRFFSTYANSYENNYSRLLDELKPMRERVSIDQIRNISQVLQRDLDDLRIAHGLVPYLMNLVNGIRNPNHIPFFPAILGVLIPRNYLTEVDRPTYPNFQPPIQNEREKITEYKTNVEDAFSWSITQVVEGARITPLSLLKIDVDKTEIIVLDGQHRSNAFRIVSQKFFNDPENEVYEPYYDQNAIYPPGLRSDLPVTLIWFEKVAPEAEIVPDFITRRIFIDVNNSAKTISQSRQILLDDRDPSSILANSFYSTIAERRGFTRTNDLSLIHLGFDINTELRDRRKNSILNISNPEIINVVFDWFFFGSRRYNELREYNVGADRTLKWNPGVLSELLPSSRPLFNISKDEEGNQIKTITNPDRKSEVSDEFISKYHDAFYRILNNFQLFSCHFQATARIQELRDQEWVGATKKHTWDYIFVGGEGLYYSISRLIELQPERNDLRDIKDAISEIERNFEGLRSDICGLEVEASNKVFASINSVAFQVALFMSFYDVAKVNEVDFNNAQSISNSVDDFLERINSISNSVWSNFFKVVRENIVESDIDPKKWPAYEKMLIRLIQREGEFYTNPAFVQHSPEAKIFESSFKRKLSGYLDANYSGEERADLEREQFKADYADQIALWINESSLYVQDIFLSNFSISAAELMAFDPSELANTVIDRLIRS